MRSAEFPPRYTGQASRRQPEQAQKDPAKAGEHSQKRAAQVQPEREFEQHQADRSIDALPEGVPEDGSRSPGIQAVIDLQPQPDQQPAKHAIAQKQNLGWKFYIKQVFQPQPEAYLIGCPKGQGDQGDVRQPKQNSRFSMTVVQHYARQNIM